MTDTRPDRKNMRMMIAVPCMATVPTQFLSCMLDLRAICPTRYVNTTNTLVYDARNDLALNAMAGGYDRIMWIDSDMKFQPDLIERLSKRIDDGADLACGLFFTRHIPTEPVIYKSIVQDRTPDGIDYIRTEKFLDYPKDDVFRIAGCGFGAVMTTTDLIRRVYERFGLPFFPLPSIGEDIAFCWRANQLGAVMVCDSSVRVGHIGYTEYNESLYEMLGGNRQQFPSPGYQKPPTFAGPEQTANGSSSQPAGSQTPERG